MGDKISINDIEKAKDWASEIPFLDIKSKPTIKGHKNAMINMSYRN